MLKKLFILLIEIIFPYFCVNCQKYDTLLCCNCYEEINFLSNQPKLTENVKYLDKIIVACEFDKVVKAIIYQLKYKSVRDLGKIASQIIYRSTYIPKFDYITYVPVHIQKHKLRGFNQSEEMAGEFSILTKKEVLHLLVKNKQTKSQMSVKTRAERLNNINDSIAFNIKINKELIKNKTVLIIDDVFTSGATLNECSKILKQQGASIVIGVTLAQGQ